MKNIILMGTPHHANIGDLAIAYAEEELIKKYFQKYKLYIMQEEKLDICAKRVKKYIKPDDIILLHGGGNIGDTFVTPEKGRRTVISTFPNNKIIIFPQTAYFESEEELNISKKIYNAHKNLIIMAREKRSYEFMKKHFYNAKVYLTPDIVMTLKKVEELQRKGTMIMLRKDIEKTIDNTITENIIKYAKEHFDVVRFSDMNLTVVVNDISDKKREKMIEEKCKEFQKSELVIADRLHSMIFSAITETPCVVFDSLTHKIAESYYWLKELGYIQLCDDINKLDECVKKVIGVKKRTYNNEFAEKIISDILIKEIGI